MAQQTGVAVSCSTGDREFVGKEVAAHVEDAVVELKGTRIVEEKELLIGLEDAAAPIEELGAVAAVAPEAPIHDEEVAEVAFEAPIHEEVPEVAPEMKVTAEAIAMVEEGTLAVEEDALMEQKGVFTALEEEGAAPMQESPIETQTAPAVEEIEIDEVPASVQEIVVEEDAFVVKASPTALNSKHKVFLSHSGEQKAFVERLCVALEKYYLYPFFDLRDYSLPIGKNFADLIFDAIKQCHVGVVVLSDVFFTSKWPMMELVAMVDEMKKRYFTIIPVFYSISIKEFDDPAHRKRWLSEWHELAKKNPNRVEVEKWEATLRYLRPINGLVYDGLSELSLENKIVDKICALVPPEIRLDDNHIQGREHLCKEIQDKIGALRKVQKNGICIIGLYGMGGIGKTSICKVLCNEFFIEFRGRICHAELGRKSERELMCEVVKKLTDTSHERLNGFDVDQLREALKKGIIKEAVFLAVDNISDSDASIKEAMNYLSASLPSGSIVMVTARSKDFLKNLRPYIDESKCLEMPDLKVEHAVLLFAKASHFEPRNEDDKQLLKRCVQKGYFQKGDGNASCHFHPLALDVLGRHLGRRDPNEWGAQLDEIDRIGEDRRRRNPVSFIGKDIINPRIEAYDSIFYESVFPIFRTSFVTLSDDEQLLVMDIALNLFPEDTNAELHALWIGIVHGIPSIEKVKISLEKLKSLSLLESLGDGRKISIGMHDLWRAFCIAETEHGKLKRQRWVYQHMDKCSKLVENSPSVTWKSVKRMAFLDCELKSLERVNFAYFPNVTVLKIRGINMTKELVVNLSGLIHLKSLEVSGRYSQRLIVQGLPRSLMYLSLVSDAPGLLRGRCLDPFFGTSAAYFSRQIEYTTTLLDEKISEVDKFSVNELNLILELSRELITYVGGLKHWKSRSNSCRGDHCKSGSNSRELIDQIVGFEDLQFLLLVGYGRGKVLDMRSMVSMRAAGFDNCENLVTLTGLSSKMTNLRGLSFEGCKKLRSCPGVGDLVVLEVLNCKGCRRLRRLPNLQKLINLRKLNISGCPLIVEVPGLRHLVALKKFSAGASDHEYYLFRSYRLKLPDMNRLSNLQTLRLRECRLKADTVLGLSDLISLQRLEADFREIADRPSLGQLTKVAGIADQRVEFRRIGRIK